VFIVVHSDPNVELLLIYL